MGVRRPAGCARIRSNRREQNPVFPPTPMKILAIFSLLLTVASSGAAVTWLTDYEAARKQAAQEGKDLLLEFTGSDWCPPCMQLKQEVFDVEVFQEWVADKFVLVRFDFPRDDSALSEEQKKQNEANADAYLIEGYPTVVLADAQGRPYATTSYQSGGAESYVRHLEALRNGRVARDRAFEEAGQLEGVERAKALLNGLSDLADGVVDRFYPDVAQDIIASDPEDQSGFQEGRSYRKAVAEYEQQMEALFAIKQFTGAVKTADEFVATHQPVGKDLQHILMGKLMALVEVGKEEEAFGVMEEIRGAAPDSVLSGQLDELKARLEQYMRQHRGALPVEEGSGEGGQE